MTWKNPVSHPEFVELWTRILASRDHDKPTALGTRFRYSDALNCSRRMVFDAMGVERTDPIDPAGIHVTTLGTYVHEEVQGAIEFHYGEKLCGFEVVSGTEIVSGSADAQVNLSDGITLFELKTVGGFAFDKAIGVNRKAYKRGSPEGPRPSAIVQAGLNALHLGCERVVVGYIAMEAISKQLAERVGLSMYERFTAEWEIPEEVWRPMAQAEMDRLEELNTMVDAQLVPPGDFFDDKTWEWQVPISPLMDRRPWTCEYCPHLTTCTAYENGIPVLPEQVGASA